ncbi:MAG: hypothetical protein AAGI07_19185, partial [Bacteroidota bacterium]
FEFQYPLDKFLKEHTPFNIRDGEPAQHYTILLKQTFIKALVKEEVSLIFGIKAKIKIKTDRAKGISKAVDFDVKIKLSEDLGSDWLAIDFGTSAILAAFGNSDTAWSKDLAILHLQNRLAKISFNHEPTNASSLLTSSMMLLREGKEIYAESYEQSFIDISPNEDNLVENTHKRGLPYLRSLLGSSSLVEVNPNLDGLVYKEDEIQKSISIDSPPITDILKAVYWSLIKHITLPEIVARSGRLHQLVLTVPNSFTPVHIEKIKEGIYASVDRIKRLEFISESDAISFRYYDIRKRLTLNRNRAVQARIERKEIEYVLVCDVGASTIDLTYFSIEQKESQDKINILGRMSKNAAGNYFDFVIAYAIQQYTGFELIAHENLEVKIAVKNYIKDILKPLLANYDYPFSRAQMQKNIRLLPEHVAFDHLPEGQIYASPKVIFDTLIPIFRENSIELLEKFFILFGYEISDGKYPEIDTLILTGRASQLLSLQYQIENNTKQLSNNQELFVIKYITKSATDDFGLLEKKELKSMVTLGALSYAVQYRNQKQSALLIERNNLQAKYGLLYGNRLNYDVPWQFVELLSPNSESKGESIDPLTGQKIYTYMASSDLISVVGYIHFMFVMTYEPDPAEAYYNFKQDTYNTDYIFNMLEFDLDDLQLEENTYIKVHASINTENALTFRVTNQEGITLIRQTHHTLIRSNSVENDHFSRSLWPYGGQKFINVISLILSSANEYVSNNSFIKTNKTQVNLSETMLFEEKIDVFISSSLKEIEVTKEIVKELREYKLDVWWENEQVLIGLDVHQVFNKAIENSESVVI